MNDIIPPDLLQQSQAERWASYFWPGEQVLHNLLDIHDKTKLHDHEYRTTAQRELELRTGKTDIPRTGDMLELRRLHAHLFGDVYTWAGQYRTCSMRRADQDFVFAREIEEIAPYIDDHLRSIPWPDLNFTDFVDRTSHSFLLLNWAHPFREGNGRTTRLFMQRQVEHSPYTLDYSRVHPDEWNTAFKLDHPTHDEWPTDHPNLSVRLRQIAVARSTDPNRPLDPVNPADLNILLDRALQRSGSDISDAVAAAGLTPHAAAHASAPDPAGHIQPGTSPAREPDLEL
ncbi:Fic/DOC family protein [Nocardia carnea]|uniref:Fic/DOC family protein n=1 Tax=Nocardia carnea TaxID=37328 RepID=UPI002454079D|nr:Fic family protein [Nocardia carnea]